MFHKRFERHWNQRRDERGEHNEHNEHNERGERGGPHGHFFHRPHWHGHERGRGRDEGAWFAPRDDDHGFRRGGPFGRWPFGGDSSDEDGGGRRRQRRGDIRYALLELLAEQPRHGYELIKEIEQRYGGFYRPSPGTIYPTLQLLEDEGHLTSAVNDGKRVYTITESGQKLLEESQQRGDEGRGRGPDFGRGQAGPELQALQQSMFSLMGSVMQSVRHASPQQVQDITTLVNTTRREVYAILAKEETSEPENRE